MTVCAGVFCTSAANQARLYIPDFTVQGVDPVEVQIMLDNPTPVLGYSFNIEMPAELEIVDGSVDKTDRFNEGQIVGFKNNTFLSVSNYGKPFYNSYGSVGTFQVKAKTPVVGEKQVTIKLKNIAIATPNNSNNVTVAEETTTVTLTDKPDNVNLTMSLNPETAVINPGGIQEISVAMDNNADINGMQMTLVLPDGFSIAGDGGQRFQQSARLDGFATIAENAVSDNVINIIISSMMSNLSLKEGEGEFMSFKVKAPENFDAESVEILFTNIQASVYTNKNKKVNDVSMSLTNGKIAYSKALEEIQTLEEALTEAMQTIENECPDVKDLFPGDEIATRIETLKSDVDLAYEQLILTPDYDSIMEPAADIRQAIESLVESAKEAQKANDEEKAAELARQEAYSNATALIEALNSSLDKAIADIAENCPDVKDYFTGEEIAASIESMKQAINAAYEDKSLVENYDKLTAPASDIEDAIANLVEDAKDAQKAFEENAALESARLKANAALATLDKAFADALLEIETECPDVKHLYTGVAIQQQITVLRNAVNAAYDDKSLVENYDEIMAPETDIAEAIQKLVEDAKAAQKKIDEAEDARQKANAEAYEADLAAIEALRNKLDAAKIEIEENYPEYIYTPYYNKIAAEIATLKAAADKEFERVANEGNYSYQLNTLPVEAMIEDMLQEARISGVEDIFADELNGEIRIYTTDGKQVSKLQQGKVNIIVKADGRRHKIFVK